MTGMQKMATEISFGLKGTSIFLVGKYDSGIFCVCLLIIHMCNYARAKR